MPAALSKPETPVDQAPSGISSEPVTAAPSSRKSTCISHLCWGGLFCLLLLLLAFLRGWLPIAPVAVATGSMEPSIHIGDAVIVCQTDPLSLQVGDIIQYERNGMYVIHRIVEKTETEMGESGFITQGDSNNAPDEGIVSPDEVRGKVLCTIPKVGYVSLWLQGHL